MLSIKEEILERSIPEPNSGCWIWVRGQSSGYGRFKINRRPYLAHRVSYRVFKGKIPPGLWVLHNCNNSFCVNPDHLKLGTPHDNNMDRIVFVKRSGRINV